MFALLYCTSMSVSDLCLCSMSFCVFLCVYVFMCILFDYILVCLRLSLCCMWLCPWVCTLYFVPVCVFFAFKVHSSTFTRFRSCFWRFRNKIFPTIFSPDVIFFFNSRPFFYVVFTLIKLSGLEVSHQPPPEIHSKTQTDTGNQAQSINHSTRVADPERLEAEIRIPLFNIVTDPDPKIRVV